MLAGMVQQVFPIPRQNQRQRQSPSQSTSACLRTKHAIKQVGRFEYFCRSWQFLTLIMWSTVECQLCASSCRYFAHAISINSATPLGSTKQYENAMAIVTSGPRKWIVPGAKGLVKFEDDGVEYERIFTWPFNQRGWVVFTPTGQYVAEDFGEYERLRKAYAVAVAPTADEAECFDAPIEDDEMAKILKEGRYIAERMRTSQFRYVPERAVTWRGETAAVPTLGVLDNLTRRVTRKHAIPSVPIDDGRPLGDGMNRDGAADAAAAAATAKPGDGVGKVWACFDVDCHLGLGRKQVPYGTVVDLSPKALISKDSALETLDDGSVVMLRRVLLQELPYIVEKHRLSFGVVTPRADAVGAQLGLPGGAQARGGAGAAAPTPVDVTDDLRTLWVDYDSLGVRFKPFRLAVEESVTVTFKDSPYPGTACALNAAKRMMDESGDARGWFAEFCRERRITRRDKVWHDMSAIIDAVTVGATIDQLNVGGLMIMECLFRRLMALAEAHERGPDYPNWQLATFISSDYRRGDLLPADFRSEVSRKAKEHLELENLRKRLSDQVPRTAPAAEVEEALEAGGLPSSFPPNRRAKAKAKAKAKGGGGGVTQ